MTASTAGAGAMTLSPIGATVLIAREGRRLSAYRDGAGIWTIGVGHTSAAGPPAVWAGLTISAKECDAIFARDVARFVKAVRDALDDRCPDLPQHAFDALVSLCFNIGPAAFLRSSVLRRLRSGDTEAAAQAILMWNRPSALIPRRQAEHDQFRTPYATTLPRARRTGPAPATVRRTVPSSVSVLTPAATQQTIGWLDRLKRRFLHR